MEVRKVLRKPKLEYVFKQNQGDVRGAHSVGDLTLSQYLIEISPDEEDDLPSGWSKVSGTKTVLRYHTPTIVEVRN